MPYSTKRLSHVFKALANERRMMIIKLLTSKRMPVINLSTKLKLSFKSVSKHLQKMEREGLVSKKQEGKYMYYKLSDTFRKSGVCKQILESK